MKKAPSLLLFLVLTAGISAQRSVAPPASPAMLSFSLMPAVSVPFQPDGTLDIRPNWFGPSVGITISCQYDFPSSPWCVGTELGYSYLPYAGDQDWLGNLSILQAGLSAGLEWRITPSVGVRGIVFGGYSYTLVQPRISDDLFSSFFRLNYSSARSGTPFVGAGAELSWTFVPAVSLTAGVRVRYFFDVYADLPITLGLSYNWVVGRTPGKPFTQRATPLKQAPTPRLAEKLALSLNPADPALLALSERISSCMAPPMNRTVDRNLQSAVGVHAALRALGVTAVVEPGAPRDSVKPPRQTLSERTGDCRDLSVLYCSLLQALQVQTAFIATSGHVFIAFALATGPDEARKSFSHAEELFFREGKVWVPLEACEGDASFLTAWQAGAQRWRTARKVYFYPVGTLSSTEKPAESAASGSELLLPQQAQLLKGFEEEMEQLVTREFLDKEARLLAAVALSSANPKASNALGLLYARHDRREQAEAPFQAALTGSEYFPALVNLGNLRLLGKRPVEALGFFQRAAAVAPDDSAVLLGLARSRHALQYYQLAKLSYDDLLRRYPGLAAQFSYLRLRGEEAEKAAVGVKELMVWAEEE